MAFPEQLKVELRRRSDMRCCLCHALGIEIHHIIPECDGGPDTEENAAPLCPSCHDTFGANPEKRKFIREAKANWLAVCDRRVSAVVDASSLLELLKRVATREDLRELRRDLTTAPGDGANWSIRTFAPSNPDKSQPLGQILAYLHCLPLDERVREKDENFVYDAAFGYPWSDQETELIKQRFIDTFGTATARRLCRLALHRHPLSRFGDGFTDEDFDDLMGPLIVDAILLVHHPDLNPKDEVVNAAVLSNAGLTHRF